MDVSMTTNLYSLNLTTSTSNTTETETYVNKHIKMMSLIFGVILPFIFATVGTIGNILSIVVLIKVMVRGTRLPLFLILIALAASDSLLLILIIILNVMSIGYTYVQFNFMLPMYLVHGKIIVMFWPMSLAVQMISVYLTVLVSYERWLAVCRPFHASKQCSLKRISLIITGIIIVSVAYNAPHWWEYETNTGKIKEDQAKMLPPSSVCDPNQTLQVSNEINLFFGNSTTRKTDDPRYWKLLTLLLNNICNVTIVDYFKSKHGKNIFYRYVYNAGMYAAVMFLLPFLAITSLNVALVRTVQRSRKKWSHMSRSQRNEVKLSTVPLAIVALFYFFGMPAVVTNLVDAINSETALIKINQESWQAYLAVSNFCVVLNSSINFVIYSMLGEKFRHTLMTMCGCAPAGPRLQRHQRALVSATDQATEDNQRTHGCTTRGWQHEEQQHGSTGTSEVVELTDCGAPLMKSLPLGGTERVL